MTGSSAALGLTVALYLLGAALLGANLALRRPGLLIAGRSAAIVGVLLHAAAIGLRCVERHSAPFTTPAESLSLLAWIVALVYLAIELLWKLSASGPFALGLSFLLILLGAVLHGDSRHLNPSVATNPLLGGNAISLHIIAILSAIAAFALAFCCAALYLIAHRILKSKHGLIWMKRLPPLLTVENVAFTLVAVGFPLLTMGILSGMIVALGGGLHAGWQTDPKTLLAYAVWVTYAIYLWARLGAGWPATRTSWVLLVGLALSLLLFFIPTATHQFV
jgi:ABC-type uncharacterized transport system permease subunit